MSLVDLDDVVLDPCETYAGSMRGTLCRLPSLDDTAPIPPQLLAELRAARADEAQESGETCRKT